jgi:hypothetical protein
MKEEEIQRILRGRNVEVIAYEMEHAAWVQSLAPWDIYITGTYRWPASEDSVRRTSERWFHRQQPGVPVFYGIDPNPSGDGGHHMHGLAATSGGMYRKDAWADWYSRYGVGRIVPVTAIGGVSGYLAKYPLTGSRWWNVLNCVDNARANNFSWSHSDSLLSVTPGV